MAVMNWPYTVGKQWLVLQSNLLLHSNLSGSSEKETVY